MLESREEQTKMAARVAEVFSPSAPIDQARLFAGRIPQVNEVINVVSQRGQHAILYGERGVGKTSLANVLSEFLPDIGLGGRPNSVIVNCDETTSFSSLWHQIAREISLINRTRQMGFNPKTTDTQVSLDSFLPKDVTPAEVRHLFQSISSPTIIIIDEMDRIKDQRTTTLLADTAKTLSDHSVNTTLILVGVADSVDDLIAEHRSIERALVQIYMQRMSNDELFEIVDKGLGEVEMTIESEARRQITELSQGLPHFTHLLSLHATQRAIYSGRTNVTKKDVTEAIKQAVAKAQQSIIGAYHAATSSPRDTLFPQVLLACALAKKDQLGYFSAADVRAPMTNIMGKSYDIPAYSRHLNIFCEEERGPILQKTGQRKRFKYRFINPMIEPFAVMSGLASGLIAESVLGTSS